MIDCDGTRNVPRINRRNPLPSTNPEIQQQRLSWFINLRWIAVAGGFAILLLGPSLLPLDIRYGELLPCVAALGLFNVGYLFYWRNIQYSSLSPERMAFRTRGLLHFQMIADLFLLTLMLFLSGGAENPIVFFYLFHLAISAILFTTVESLFYAGLALGLPWLLYFLQRLGPRGASIWEGMAGLSQVHEKFILWAYSAAVAGLWFFLSRLASELHFRERSLRETGEQLHKANEQLKQLDEYKNHFLRQVIYKLKSPAIDMDFDLSQVEKDLSRKNVKALDAVQAAKKRVWALLELIEDLTWLSRAGVGDMPFQKEWIDVYELVLHRIQNFEKSAGEKGISFKLHGDPQLRLKADPQAFGKVAENLLSNAVKYTPAGFHPVVVELKVSEGWLVLTVQDEGIGIPPKQQKRIFDDFFRASNAKSHEKFGTGLGLSIVKRIVDGHGGRVVLASSPQEGTKVEAWWPLESAVPTMDRSPSLSV